MTVFDLYSKRKKREQRAGQPDVFQYDTIPRQLRVQIQYILADAIGQYHSDIGGYYNPPNNNDAWDFIRKTLCKEKGQMTLEHEENPMADCMAYLLITEDSDDCLDLVEFSFFYIDRIVRKFDEYARREHGIDTTATDAITELNTRFREAGVGYQFSNGRIIRIDSELIHSEVVKPALQFLSDRRFAGAQQEFLAAHGHYRAGEHKDAVIDALNAFESTLKTICDLKKWKYEKGARASDLLKLVRANSLLPGYLDKSFDQLVATLQSGLPKVRNEAGGHGQGATPQETPAYVAAYALHLAAAKIVMLVEAFRVSEK